MDDRVIISLYGNDIIQDMQVVENLFHFQISTSCYPFAWKFKKFQISYFR